MSEGFSAGSAAFDIFGKRDRGFVLTGATVAYILSSALLLALIAVLAWPHLTELVENSRALLQRSQIGDAASSAADPQFIALMRSYYSLSPILLLFMLLSFILRAAYEAAVHRWLVRGETGAGFFGLNLGADTWRVYFTYWIWFLVVIAIALGAVVAFLVLGGALAFAFSNTNSTALGVGLGILLACAIAFTILYIAVRLAPAAATSVGRKRFAFFDAWRVTEGHFWALLGAYLISFLLYILIVSVISGVITAIIFGPVFSVIAQGGSPDPAVLLQSFTTSTLALLAGLYLLIGLIVLVFQLALMGISARAVRVAIDDGRIEGPAAA